jgi:aminoglycoside/choline kinase family phosphotransferase
MIAAGPLVPEEDDFLRLQALLHRAEWPVPAVEGVLAGAGLVVLEDLGDTFLHRDAGLRHYREAVDLLVRLHALPARAADAGPPWNRAFDARFYQRELTLFIDAFQALTGSQNAAARQDFLCHTAPLCQALASLPKVVCHRDYHCRNLLLHDGRVRVIDFQDARMGPRAYDLASLLEDPYAGLPAEERRQLLMRYRQAAGEGEVTDEGYLLATCQRLLKAAGTYAMQAVHRHDPSYLPFIAPALAGASRAAQGLTPLLPDLAAAVAPLRATWEARR